MRPVPSIALISAAAILAGCAGSKDTAERSTPASGQPVATAPAPAPVGPEGCAQGMSIEEQKVRLIEIAKAQFLGENDQGLPSLQFGPDAKDHRRGGIWLVLEFNGDELETVALKKAALDRQMRDAYGVFYTSGCDELVWVDLTAIQLGLAKVFHIPTYKTRLKRIEADAIDWANKEALDFDEIWDTLILNTSWRRELAELEQSG